MKRPFVFRLFLLALLLVLILDGRQLAGAQSGGGYDLTWGTIDNGGGESSGGGYSLSGTIGQPDAGTLSGSGYTLVGGFWAGAISQYPVYLPLVIK